jgi:hypothetical protein
MAREISCGAKRIQLAIGGRGERKALTCEDLNTEEEAKTRKDMRRQGTEALKKILPLISGRL